MIRVIRKWLDKQTRSDGLVRSGKWRVLYNDGHWSRRTTYDMAVESARVFGGEVYWVRYDDPAKGERK